MGILTLLCLMTAVAYTYQSTLPTNVVEIYFVVDKKVVDNYITERTESTAAAKETAAKASIRADAEYFLTEVNQILTGMSSEGLNIEVRIRQLDILDTNIYSGASVDVEIGLPQFETWLTNQGSYATLNYDLAMLWTGFELTGSGSTSTSGYATVGSVCRGQRASSIVEFDGTYHTVTVTAHEMAHNLGASHDGSAKETIMAPSASADAEDRWEFSLCSISDMKATIEKLGSENCLLTTNSASTVPSQTITDELEDPNVICARSIGDQDSTMCKGTNFYDGSIPQGDAVCKSIWCSVPGTSSCRSAFSSDGLICGTSKRCDEGTCMPDSSPETANIDPDCIWGDQGEIKVGLSSGTFEGSCSALVAQEGDDICYSDFVETTCCGTCAEISTDISGCEYGDRWDGCTSYSQSQVCPSYSDYWCCGYCQGYTGKRDADDNNSTIVIPPSAFKEFTVENLQKKEPKKEDQPTNEF